MKFSAHFEQKFTGRETKCPVGLIGDEQKYGEYRTKRVILECYDGMAEAMKTGRPYQTILDPPPADPRVTHQPRSSYQSGK